MLVNGATGTTGRQAIQAARLLRGVARNWDGMRRGAAFKQALGSGVQVVLEYLWGYSAEVLLRAATGRGSMRGEPRIRYVQIGLIGGDPIALLGGILRTSGLELLGSGLGSFSAARCCRR